MYGGIFNMKYIVLHQNLVAVDGQRYNLPFFKMALLEPHNYAKHSLPGYSASGQGQSY